MEERGRGEVYTLHKICESVAYRRCHDYFLSKKIQLTDKQRFTPSSIMGCVCPWINKIFTAILFRIIMPPSP
jgi:hypothetical protein